MYKVQLSASEIGAVKDLTEAVTAQFDSIEDEAFLRECTTMAHELPASIRTVLNDFRLYEASSTCLISGYPVDDDLIGDTPTFWGAQPKPSRTLREEAFFLLCVSLLGDAVGWATQQDSRIMHDILPIRGHEKLQLNSASEMTIWWHTEDAFHPYRADYVGLMCLRNPDVIETTYSSIGDVKLALDVIDILFQPRFLIQPDNSHLPLSYSESSEAVDGNAGAAARNDTDPLPIAVLFGDRSAPYLRLDPYFMKPTPEDPVAMAALAELVRALDENQRGIALEPGQILLVDNYAAVHGRKSFTARYDGRDRWLKRLNITRDLRKSRSRRVAPASRVLL